MLWPWRAALDTAIGVIWTTGTCIIHNVTLRTWILLGTWRELPSWLAEFHMRFQSKTRRTSIFVNTANKDVMLAFVLAADIMIWDPSTILNPSAPGNILLFHKSFRSKDWSKMLKSVRMFGQEGTKEWLERILCIPLNFLLRQLILLQ